MSNHTPKDREKIGQMARDPELSGLAQEFFLGTCRYKYSYNFSWLGRPVIQYPQDLIAMQEIIWEVKPDLIIETGIAHGGSLIFYASILELIGQGEVIGVDIEIRPHNREAIESHRMFKRISLMEGSSIDPAIARRVRELSLGKSRVMVVLDSNHTHRHVLHELELYSGLVTKGSYLVVFDTVVEQMPKEFFPDRPWGPGDNPMSALKEFLQNNDRFVVDEEIHQKLLITVAPGGFLKCVKD
jgi:cephalosporin hydroxylase